MTELQRALAAKEQSAIHTEKRLQARLTLLADRNAELQREVHVLENERATGLVAAAREGHSSKSPPGRGARASTTGVGGMTSVEGHALAAHDRDAGGDVTAKGLAMARKAIEDPKQHEEMAEGGWSKAEYAGASPHPNVYVIQDIGPSEEHERARAEVFFILFICLFSLQIMIYYFCIFWHSTHTIYICSFVIVIVIVIIIIIIIILNI